MRDTLILNKFHQPLKEWFSIALAEEGVLLVPITPIIAIEAYSLPDESLSNGYRVINSSKV